MLAVSKVKVCFSESRLKDGCVDGAIVSLPCLPLQLYSTYSTKSPFLVEQFQDYFLGGLDDMAFWSTNIYRLTSFMLENGTR